MRDAAIVVDGGPVLTTGAWRREAAALAGGLAARGVRPGDGVALRFDGRSWDRFAVAHLGVRLAGGVAVLVSPGAATIDVARAVAHSGAVGLLSPPALAVQGGWWLAAPDDSAGPPVDGSPGGGERLYPAAPLAAPVPWCRTAAEVEARPDPLPARLVHLWAPGTPGGRYALAVAAAGGTAVAVPALSVARLRAAAGAGGTVGVSPAAAAALLAGGLGEVAGVERVLLSGPGEPVLLAALALAFPGALVEELPGCRPPTPATGGPPAAVSQAPMLWHEQFAPGSFNLPCLVRRYRGPLDLEALAGALADLAARHEPLRTTFDLAGAVPRQVVGPPPPPGLPVADLSALPPAEQDPESARLLADLSARPFDLVTGPLFEPHLLRLGDDDHVVAIRLHHTVFDDWSVDVYRRELSALYAARVGGPPAPPPPRARFADHAEEERAALASRAEAAQLAWWREELDGAPLAVQLALGRGEGPPATLDLSPDLSATVRGLARRLRATPYMAALAAFAVLTARRTGQDDLVLAAVVAHRADRRSEDLIGCFTKKVPLRLRLAGSPTFAELVDRARRAVLGALANQDAGFDAVVADSLLPAAAEHGAVPQLNVVFQGETPQPSRMVLPGLAAGPYDPAARSRAERHFSARSEEERTWGDGMYLGSFLIVSLVEGDRLSLVARGVFDRAAGRDLLEEYAALLADLVADPDRPVAVERRDPPDGVVDVRGLRAARSRLEAAVAGCPGVASADLAVRGGRLHASVVAEPGRPAPSLGELRAGQWAALPGSLWPAEVDGARPERDPAAVALEALWTAVRGAPPAGGRYWQDFTFLAALAEAREAGMVLPDEAVARNRTLDALVADARPAFG